MRSEEEFSVISCIVVVDGVLRAELYALDLLKIYVVNTLCSADCTAVLESFPRFLDGFVEFSVEKRRGGGKVYFVVTLLSAEVKTLPLSIRSIIIFG